VIHEYQIRVRYAETDQMRYVYYGNYAQYFEVGRVEFLRSRGLSYKDLEAEGVMMPVVALNIKYKRPAKYDDLLMIRSQVAALTDKRVVFTQEVFSESDKLLTEGKVELAFIDSKTMRPINCPPHLREIFDQLVNDKD
jgi:acyl-CoA thioester hydrolase